MQAGQHWGDQNEQSLTHAEWEEQKMDEMETWMQRSNIACSFAN